MKKTAWLLILVMAFAIAGCAQKTASEQLKDDMKKAANKMDKEMQGLLK